MSTIQDNSRIYDFVITELIILRAITATHPETRRNCELFANYIYQFHIKLSVHQKILTEIQKRFYCL